MGMAKEFRTFIARGSVVDLAVGVIIGAAFGAIIKSLVDDVIMPVIGYLMGGRDFSTLAIRIGSQVNDAGEIEPVLVRYGLFINAIVQFLLVAFIIFLLIRAYNRMRGEPLPAEPTEKTCPFCLLSVPIAASRCAHCTSELPATVPAAGV